MAEDQERSAQRSNRAGLLRREALDHHRKAQDEVRLPHYATLPVRVALWSLIVIVVAATGLAFTTSVPRFTTGRAVVLDTPEGPTVAMLLPPAERRRVREGQPLSVTFDQAPEPIVTRVVSVESPGERVGRGACFVGTPANAERGRSDAPAAALAPLPRTAPSVAACSVGSASVRTGRQSLLSWLAP